MRSRNSLLVLVCLIVSAAGAHAEHYAVSVSGIFTDQFFNGTTGITKSIPVTNASILKGIVASGTSGETKTSAMDIVTDDEIFNFSIDVIDRTTHHVVLALGRGGQDYVNGAAIYNIGKSSASHHQVSSGYTITFPTSIASQPILVNVDTTYYETLVGERPIKYTISVAGGTGFESNGATFFQGTIRKASRVYPY